MTTSALHPAGAAALFKAWVERRGGTFQLTAEGDMRCDLNAMRDFGTLNPDLVAAVVMELREDIKRLVAAERVKH